MLRLSFPDDGDVADFPSEGGGDCAALRFDLELVEDEASAAAQGLFADSAERVFTEVTIMVADGDSRNIELSLGVGLGAGNVASIRGPPPVPPASATVMGYTASVDGAQEV